MATFFIDGLFPRRVWFRERIFGANCRDVKAKDLDRSKSRDPGSRARQFWGLASDAEARIDWSLMRVWTVPRAVKINYCLLPRPNLPNADREPSGTRRNNSRLGKPTRFGAAGPGASQRQRLQQAFPGTQPGHARLNRRVEDVPHSASLNNQIAKTGLAAVGLSQSKKKQKARGVRAAFRPHKVRVSERPFAEVK